MKFYCGLKLKQEVMLESGALIIKIPLQTVHVGKQTKRKTELYENQLTLVIAYLTTHGARIVLAGPGNLVQLIS